MKKIIILMIMLTFSLEAKEILDTNIVSGWVQNGNHKEQSLISGPINYIKLNSQNNLIYLRSNDTVFKFNLNDGKLLKRFKQQRIADINTDKEEYVTEGVIHNYPNLPTNFIFDLNTDTLKRSLNVVPNIAINGVGLAVNHTIPYYSNKNDYIITKGYCDGFVGGSYYNYSTGYASLSSPDTNTFYFGGCSDGAPNVALLSNDAKSFAVSSQINFEYYITHQKGSEIYNTFKDSNNKEHPFLLENGNEIKSDFINFIEFSLNNSYILGTIGNTIYIFDLKSMKPISSFNGYQIHFTNSSKRVITLQSQKSTNQQYYNTNVQIRSLQGDLINDSLFLIENYTNNVFCKIDSSEKILIGGSDGKLKLLLNENFNKPVIGFFKKTTDENYALNPIQFLDNSNGNIKTWLWDFGDSSFSYEKNPIHTYIKSGNYSVKLIVSDGIQTDSLKIDKFIKLKLKANLLISTLDSVAPLKVNFKNTSYGDGNIFKWYFGDGDSSNLENPIHIYKKIGIFNVKLIVTNGNLIDTIIKNNLINVKLPIHSFFDSDYKNNLAPVNIHFVNKSIGNINVFKWYFGDGDSSNLPIPSHTYTKAGKFNVTLIVSDGVYSDTLTKVAYITVKLPLLANFEYSNNIGEVPFKVLFTDKSTGDIVSRLWKFGDGDTSIVQNPSHTYTKEGNFTVSLIVSDGKNSSTYTKEKFISVSKTGVSDLTESNYILHPNPASNYIELPVEIEFDKEINIYSSAGNLISKAKAENNKLDITNLVKGVYFIKLNDKMYKFVKE